MGKNAVHLAGSLLCFYAKSLPGFSMAEAVDSNQQKDGPRNRIDRLQGIAERLQPLTGT
jgi:hypothetical protein